MAKQTVPLNNMNYFKLDNVEFSGLIGYKMLKTTNQLNYPVSPGRQIDGSMKNINDYKAFVIPKVEIGFNLIDIEEYWKLREILLSKRIFQTSYYDNDFRKMVTHEMYAEPDDLKDFTNIGADILGVQNFKICFVGTLNEKTLYTATFSNSSTVVKLSARWGSEITVPDGKWVNNNSFSKIYYYGGDKMILFGDVTLTAV